MSAGARSSYVLSVRRWTIIFALGLAACSDDVAFLSLAGLEDSLLILARTDSGGALLETKISSAPAYFPANDGDTLHAFALDKNLLRDAEGGELDPAELTLAEKGACGRCAFPAASAPFVLEPGNRCALPSFFEHRASEDTWSEDQVTQLRALIHLERAGDCTCSDLEVERTLGSFSECAVEPAPVPHRWHQLAITDDGAIAAIHPSTVLTATIGFAPVFHPLEVSFVRSPALTAIGPTGRRFLAVGRTQTILNDIPEELFLRLDGDSVEAFDLLRELGELAKGAVYDPSRSSIFLFGPSTEGNEARVWRCNEALTACTSSELPRCGGGRQVGITGSAVLSSGDIVAPTVNGHLYHLPGGSDQWTCRLSEQIERIGPLANNPVLLLTNAYDHTIVTGGRLYACGHGREDDSDNENIALLLSAELSLADTTWYRGAVALYAEEGAPVRCRGLWHDRNNNELLAFFDRDSRHEVLAFDLQGRLLGRRDGPGLSDSHRPARFPDLDEVVTLVRESPNGRNLLLSGVNGTLAVERDGIFAMLGPEPAKQAAFAVALGDGALLLGGGRAPAFWDGGCQASSLETRAPLEGAVSSAVALFDGTVAVLSDSGAAIYDPNAGVVSRVDLQLPDLLASAAISNDELVLLDTSGRAQVLTLSRAQLLPLAFDSAPGVSTDERPTFEALSGTLGIGWLSGGGLHLARIVRGTGGLRGELWWGEAIATSLQSGEEPLEADFFGPSAILPCGAAVLYVRALVRRIGDIQYLARSVLLEPKVEGGYRTRVASGFSNQARFGLDSFTSIPLRMSSDSNAVMGFRDGLLVRPDSEPLYAPVPSISSIVEVNENLVYTDQSGNRIFLRSP